MRSIASKVHAGLSFLTLAAVVVQFFLAGLGVFGAEPYDAHKMNGYLILVAALILLVLALIGRLDRERIGTSAGLVVLMIVQIALIESGRPWIEAIHPLLALAILGASFRLAIRGRVALAGEGLPAEPQEQSEPSATRSY